MSLFGAATQPSASLFGVGTAGGGLFGAAATGLGTANPSTGLFSSSTTSAAGGGLFGSGVTPQPSLGATFGSSTSGMTASLFGGAAPAGTGGAPLFGASAPALKTGVLTPAAATPGVGKTFLPVKPTMKDIVGITQWREEMEELETSLHSGDADVDSLRLQMTALKGQSRDMTRAMARKEEEAANLAASQSRTEEALERFRPSLNQFQRQCLSLQQTFDRSLGHDHVIPQPLAVPSVDYIAFINDMQSRGSDVARLLGEAAQAVQGLLHEASSDRAAEQAAELTAVMRLQASQLSALHRKAGLMHERTRGLLEQARRSHNLAIVQSATSERPTDSPYAAVVGGQQNGAIAIPNVASSGVVGDGTVLGAGAGGMGMFGAGGSLLSATTPQAGAPFGMAQPQSLFGAGTDQTGGGLLGAGTTQAGRGLFGTPAVAQTGGSLFGPTAGRTGGLFGPTTPQAGGGLFGSTQGAQTLAPAGGIFGAAPPTVGGGLFGTGGGLFK